MKRLKQFQFWLVMLVLLILSILLWGDSIHVHQNMSDFTLDFSGYSWNVSDSNEAIQPGPNFFSYRNAWVDANGLHLRCSYFGAHWNCASVELDRLASEGTYVFQVQGDVTALDKNVVVGLFLYESDQREYDVEFSRWGDPAVKPLQYSVQPSFTRAYRMPSALLTTHVIHWSGNKVNFTSYVGTYDHPGIQIAKWQKTIPEKDLIRNGKLDLNIWLFNGSPSELDSSKEIIISKFMYLPA